MFKIVSRDDLDGVSEFDENEITEESTDFSKKIFVGRIARKNEFETIDLHCEKLECVESNKSNESDKLIGLETKKLIFSQIDHFENKTTKIKQLKKWKCTIRQQMTPSIHLSLNPMRKKKNGLAN